MFMSLILVLSFYDACTSRHDAPQMKLHYASVDRTDVFLCLELPSRLRMGCVGRSTGLRTASERRCVPFSMDETCVARITKLSSVPAQVRTRHTVNTVPFRPGFWVQFVAHMGRIDLFHSGCVLRCCTGLKWGRL